MMISNKRGFTLIELLVVVLIIGVLAAVALPKYEKAVQKSRMAEVAIRIKAMEESIDLYVLENGYPVSGTVDLFDVYPDLTGGLTLAEENCGGTACYGSKYAWYTARCEISYCMLGVFYSKSGNPATLPANNDKMRIHRFKYSTSWDTGECMYGVDDKDGPSLCAMLPGYRAMIDD